MNINFTTEQEKHIIAFISMFSMDTDGGQGREFMWPALPDPKMGKEFCDGIRQQFKIVAQWIKQNPERHEAAIHGFYLLDDYLELKKYLADRQIESKKLK